MAGPGLNSLGPDAGAEDGAAMSTEPTPILDLPQLQRQSLGDPTLEIEILALFSAELERLLRQLQEADTNHMRGERLRAIIALARNTGAARLLRDARLAEAHLASGDADLAKLADTAAETLAYVSGGH